MNFEDILGNSKNKEFLNKIIQTGNISHSYMFIGQSGIGKKLFANSFAKSILCLDESNKPCNKCKSCIEFENSNHPDFEYINTRRKFYKNRSNENAYK